MDTEMGGGNEGAHGGHHSTGDHFDAMMLSIHEIYKRISDKLNFWQSIMKRGKSGSGGSG